MHDGQLLDPSQLGLRGKTTETIQRPPQLIAPTFIQLYQDEEDEEQSPHIAKAPTMAVIGTISGSM